MGGCQGLEVGKIVVLNFKKRKAQGSINFLIQHTMHNIFMSTMITIIFYSGDF